MNKLVQMLLSQENLKRAQEYINERITYAQLEFPFFFVFLNFFLHLCKNFSSTKEKFVLKSLLKNETLSVQSEGAKEKTMTVDKN